MDIATILNVAKLWEADKVKWSYDGDTVYTGTMRGWTIHTDLLDSEVRITASTGSELFLTLSQVLDLYTTHMFFITSTRPGPTGPIV